MLAQFTHDGPVTTCHIEADQGSLLEGWTAEGSTRCRPTDVFIPEVGEAIALGRAIKSLGERVEEQSLASSFSFDEFIGALEIVTIVASATDR